MREVKFRGLDIDGRWFYGNLAVLTENVKHLKQGHYISNKVGMPFAYQVRPETVGEYTGVKDSNGKDIYEGDVLAIVTVVGEGWSDKPTALKSEYIVEFDKGRFHFGGWGFDNSFVRQMEVISNIHEGVHNAANTETT